MTKTILITAACFCLLGVILGAFGAHALKSKISSEMLTVFQTGIHYHFIHALALFIIGIISLQLGHNSFMTASFVLMAIGIILFSGSLYALSISGIRWLGAITPLGGLSFIFAWALLAIGIYKS